MLEAGALWLEQPMLMGEYGVREGGGHASEDFKGTWKGGWDGLQGRLSLLPQQQDRPHWLGPILGHWELGTSRMAFGGGPRTGPQGPLREKVGSPFLLCTKGLGHLTLQEQ